MNNILKRITIFDKDKNASEISEATLELGKGLPGDSHCNDLSNQITILLEPDLKDGSEKSKNSGKGLCHARFKPNLLIETDREPDLKAGDEIPVGDALLRLTQPKHCFDECPLMQNDEYCHLKTGAGFVEVIKGGQIKTR